MPDITKKHETTTNSLSPVTAEAQERPKSKSHLPEHFENRADAIDSLGPVVRVFDRPIPRQENPAHQHLISQESSDGARSKMYLLNQVARLFGAPDYEHVYWADMDAPTINSIMAKLRDLDFKPSTRNAYLSALRSVAKEAWVLKQMHLENYERIKLIKRVKESGELAGRAHDFTVLMDVVDAVSNDYERHTRNRDALILLLLIFTGMRRRELVELQFPDHIFFEQKDIYIIGKGNKYRFGRLPPPIWDKLQGYIQSERGYDHGALFCPYWNKRNFPKINNKGLNVSSINRIVERAATLYSVYRAENFPGESFKITPHDIRRSFATIMDKQGLTLREIQILLDHSNLSTTERYVRDEKEGYREKASNIGTNLLLERGSK